MIVGILSDTHGRHLAARWALNLFDRLGAGHVIHCGDICGTHVLDEMVGRPVSFVWGNMDEPDGGLPVYLETVGLTPPDGIPLRLILDQKRFAVFHGHEREFRSAVKTLDVDYILHGHTHVARNERTNGKRIINPGALQRAARKTVAALDTATDEVTFHEMRSSVVSSQFGEIDD